MSIVSKDPTSQSYPTIKEMLVVTTEQGPTVPKEVQTNFDETGNPSSCFINLTMLLKSCSSSITIVNSFHSLNWSSSLKSLESEKLSKLWNRIFTIPCSSASVMTCSFPYCYYFIQSVLVKSVRGVIWIATFSNFIHAKIWLFSPIFYSFTLMKRHTYN